SGDHLEQFVRVAGAADDVESRVGEQPGQALPQQRHVLGDNDAHGNTAVIVVRAAVVSTAAEPPAAATRSPPRAMISAPCLSPLPSASIRTRSMASSPSTATRMTAPLPSCRALWTV